MKVIATREYIHPNDGNSCSVAGSLSHYTLVKDRKVTIQLDDGNIIEAAIYYITRNSRVEAHFCISSQAGCRRRCRFCLSGIKGFRRNLTVKELCNQISLLAKENQLCSH